MTNKSWNSDLYKNILDRIYKEGYFLDEELEKKDTLYRKLSKELDVSYDSVKGWARKQSNGPSNPKVLEQIENLFGVKLTIKVKSVDGKESEETEMYSDFVKTNIKRCYDLMMDYIVSDEVEDEEVYCDMRMEIRKMSVCIPEGIFSKINNFIDENLEPIIYDHDNYFKEMYIEEIGYYDEEHCFHMKDEEATMKFLGLYMQKMFDVQSKIEQFGMEELYPLLV